MPRAKKKKVEEVEAAEEVANQVTFDTGSAGPEQCAPRPASHALAHARGPTAHQQKQLEDAMLQHAVAARVAKGVRQKAKEQEAQCSLSLRLHDAKMRRLENGEKRKRGCSSMKRAFRTYEAIIDKDEALLQRCDAKRRAAERERDAFAAEVRVLKLTKA